MRRNSYVQNDEADMGMTYDELVGMHPIISGTMLMATQTTFGRLRKVNKLGPYGMFQRLVHEWGNARKRGPDDDAPAYDPRQIAEKVKNFFHYCKS
jgi:NAD+ synthase (glutamine-hydrolysing)